MEKIPSFKKNALYIFQKSNYIGKNSINSKNSNVWEINAIYSNFQFILEKIYQKNLILEKIQCIEKVQYITKSNSDKKLKKKTPKKTTRHWENSIYQQKFIIGFF